jgi:F-type H+-transporting ATPase subunit delta
MKEIIAKRYARALIRIGQEDGQYEQYGRELRSFQELLGVSPELRAVMENPIYDKDQKKALFQALNARLKLSPMLTNFVFLLIEKRRLGYFGEIVACYDRLADEVAGRVRARVVSAIPLPQSSLQAIQGKLEAMTAKKVILTVQEDPSLIGGIVTQIGDVIYDGSIRTQLAGITETLMKG